MTELINKIGENKLIAYLATLATLVVIVIYGTAEIFAAASAVIIALFNALMNKNKGEKDV